MKQKKENPIKIRHKILGSLALSVFTVSIFYSCTPTLIPMEEEIVTDVLKDVTQDIEKNEDKS